MPHSITLIPLGEIDDTALSRDRTRLDETAMTELRLSIAASGLRMPVELFHLSRETRVGEKYGILSGYRRIQAFRGQHAMTGQARYESIPAFLREPAGLAAAFAAMVEENEIRADLSPWERGRIAVTARDQGAFESVEGAVACLFPNATRQKRARLRTIAQCVDDMDGQFTEPETFNETQILRLAVAIQKGFGDLMRAALEEASLKDAASQWQLLLPILRESEATPELEETRETRPGRPRRLLRLRANLTIRREATRDGYLLHVTGRDARGPLIDHVLDELERLFSRN